MSKLLTALVAAASIAGATAVTASPANAQWGGDWHVGGDYYYPSYGDGYGAVPPAPVYGYGAVPAAPYAIVVVPAVPAVPTIAAVPAVPTAPVLPWPLPLMVTATVLPWPLPLMAMATRPPVTCHTETCIPTRPAITPDAGIGNSCKPQPKLTDETCPSIA